MIIILMATYNGEKYIKEQIESILKQTVQDFRLIIKDDGSTDATFSIIHEYANKYPNQITCMQNEFPTGSAKGNFFLMLYELKRGLKNGRMYEGITEEIRDESHYIMFADQDDVWKDSKLEKLQSRMREMEVRYGKCTPILLHSDLEVVDEKLRRIHPSMQRMMRHRIGVKSLSELLVENDVTGNSLMMNETLAAIYFEPSNSPMHDWYLSLLARIYGKIEFVDEALTLYRQHGSNALGVKKIGFFSAMKKKLCRTEEEREEIQKNYSEMFAQVESILKHAKQIEEILSKENEKQGIMRKKNREINIKNHYHILREFLSLQGRSRMYKIFCICRNRFFKSRLIMTLGQLFFI